MGARSRLAGYDHMWNMLDLIYFSSTRFQVQSSKFDIINKAPVFIRYECGLSAPDQKSYTGINRPLYQFRMDTWLTYDDGTDSRRESRLQLAAKTLAAAPSSC